MSHQFSLGSRVRKLACGSLARRLGMALRQAWRTLRGILMYLYIHVPVDEDDYVYEYEYEHEYKYTRILIY